MIRRGAARPRAAAAADEDDDNVRPLTLNPEAMAERKRNLRRLIDMGINLYRLIAKVK